MGKAKKQANRHCKKCNRPVFGHEGPTGWKRCAYKDKLDSSTNEAPLSSTTADTRSKTRGKDTKAQVSAIHNTLSNVRNTSSNAKDAEKAKVNKQQNSTVKNPDVY